MLVSALEAGREEAEIMHVRDDLLDGEHDPKARPVDQHDGDHEVVEDEAEGPVLPAKPLGPHPPDARNPPQTYLQMLLQIIAITMRHTSGVALHATIA